MISVSCDANLGQPDLLVYRTLVFRGIILFYLKYMVVQLYCYIIISSRPFYIFDTTGHPICPSKTSYLRRQECSEASTV